MQYPLLNAFLTMLWFFLMVLWIWLLIRVIGDIFRDDTHSGASKAVWTIFVICLPLVGVFTYLIARGSGMGERETARARSYEAANMPRSNALTATQADELIRLADLKDHGAITTEEYNRAKSRVLTG